MKRNVLIISCTYLGLLKAFERIGDISIEIIDVAIEFHKNIPRSTTPRTFR